MPLVIGATVQLVTVVEDGNGLPIPDYPVVYASTNPSAATVDSATGLITAVDAGSADVTATIADPPVTSNALTIVVEALDTVPDSVTVSPSALSLAEGRPLQLTAEIKNADGIALALTPSSWTPADAGVATVDANGLVTWVSEGSTTVTAHYADLDSNACTVTALASDGALYPNEPDGYTPVSPLLTCDVLPPTTASYVPGSANDIGYIQTGGCTKIVDPTCPVGSTNTLQYFFPPGSGNGSSVGQCYTYQFPDNFQSWPFHPKRLYISYWYKISDNFPVSLGANKMLYVGVAGAGESNALTEVVTLFEGSADYPLDANGDIIHVQNGADQYTCGPYPVTGIQGDGGVDGHRFDGVFKPAPGAPDDYPRSFYFTRGVWHHLEYLYQMNSDNAYDGSLSFWINGTNLLALNNRVRFTQLSKYFVWANWTAVYNNAVPANAVNAYHHMKNLYISGKAT